MGRMEGQWADLRDEVRAAYPAIAEDVLEAIRRETAPRRHAARVCAAVEAARAGALAALGEHADDRYVDVVGSVWCRMEATGILEAGGPLLLSTARADWASALGSGRRLAGDGSAWTAAISGAAARLACGYDWRYSVLSDGELGLTFRFLASATADPEEVALWIPSPPGEVGRKQYARALACVILGERRRAA